MAGACVTEGPRAEAIVSADGGWARLADVGDDAGISTGDDAGISVGDDAGIDARADGMADPQAGVGAGEPHAAEAVGDGAAGQEVAEAVGDGTAGGETVGATAAHIAWCWTRAGLLRGALCNDLLDNSSGL